MRITTGMTKPLRNVNPSFGLRFNPADDCSMDDEFVVTQDGNDTNLTLQVGRGYVVVNEWLPAEEAMQHHFQGRTVAQGITALAKVLKAKMN